MWTCVQKCRRVLWAEAHLKWTVSKRKSVLWSDESKFDTLVGNHRRRVLRVKEEGDLPECYHHSVQKPASLMVWGCISEYGMGSLHVLEGTMNAKTDIKGFRATNGPLQTTYISGKALWNWTIQNHKLQHGFIVEESGCWIGLPAVQIFHL